MLRTHIFTADITHQLAKRLGLHSRAHPIQRNFTAHIMLCGIILFALHQIENVILISI